MNDVDADSALRELQACGVDQAAQLLEFATPERIVATCRWWRTRKGVGTGLLVSRIREGGVEVFAPEPSKQRDDRQRFAKLAERFSIGSVVEPHVSLQARRWPEDDPCSGGLVAFEALFPSLSVECDGCGFEAAYPLRVLKGL